MEIIKSDSKRVTECSNCGTALGWSENDVKVEKRRHEDYFGLQVWDERYIKCPKCSNKIIVQR